VVQFENLEIWKFENAGITLTNLENTNY